jgi:hypothetical protein
MRSAISNAEVLQGDCKNCRRPLTHLGNVPRLSLRDAVQVFACARCEIIETSAWRIADEHRLDKKQHETFSGCRVGSLR